MSCKPCPVSVPVTGRDTGTVAIATGAVRRARVYARAGLPLRLLSALVLAITAISLPVIGEGVLAQEIGLRAAGLTFAALVAGLSAVVLILPARTHRRTTRASANGRPVAQGSTT